MKEYKKEIYLLVGPRGSGKTTYCKRLIERQPELSVVNRDEILIRLFGSVHTDSYSGGATIAQLVLLRLLGQKLVARRNFKIVLESYALMGETRRNLIAHLRRLGATRIVALYFVTPVDLVDVWFWKKEGVAKISTMRSVSKLKSERERGVVFFDDDMPRRDHREFHRCCWDIEMDGFDKIIRVNAQDDLIPPL